MVILSIDPGEFLAVNTHDHGTYDAIPLLKKGRGFPRHDSFIGCRNVLMPSLSQITSKVGELDDEELNQLKAKFQVSVHLTGYQIERFSENIDTELKRRSSARAK
ncbi:MAG: hypothetical protein ACXVCH_04270 [Bdellovibrionota bacterium]